MANPAIALISRSRTFRLYWSGRILSQVGNGVALVALLLYVQSSLDTGLAVAGFLLARTVPRFFGPVMGTIADQRDQRKVMISCEVAQALIYGVIALTLPTYALLLVLVTLANAFQTLFDPAGQAALPGMVQEDELLHANTWLGTATNLQVAAGPIIGGALVALGGIRLALGVNAITFLASTLFLLRMPALQIEAREVGASVFAATRDGLRFVSRDPAARALTLLVLGCSTFLAVDAVALLFLVRNSLHGSAAAFGLSASAFGVGMVAASVVLLIRTPRKSPAVLLIAALIAGSAGTALTGVAGTLVLAAAFQIFTGVGNAVENIATDTFVQSRFNSEMVGRIWSVVSAAGWIATGLSVTIAGLVVDLTGPRAVFIGAGIGSGLIALALAPAVLRDRQES